MKQLMRFKINGELVEAAVLPNTTLLNFLRDTLGITSVKRGCDEGDCGACTVLVNGKGVASCSTLAAQVQGKEIVTVEGLSKGGELSPYQQAFVDEFAIQCGFCTPGMVLSVVALLNENPDPTEAEIRDYLRGNICRCTGYTNIINAVRRAQELLKESGKKEH